MHIHLFLLIFSVYLVSASTDACQKDTPQKNGFCFYGRIDMNDPIDRDAVQFLAPKVKSPIVKNMEPSYRDPKMAFLTKDLCYAVEIGDVGKVGRLLRGRVDVNAKNAAGNTPLMCEALRKVDHRADSDTRVARMLLAHGADISYKHPIRSYNERRGGKMQENRHPLAVAVANYREGLCQVLLDAKADPTMHSARGDNTVFQHADFLNGYEQGLLLSRRTTELKVCKIKTIYMLLKGTPAFNPQYFNRRSNPHADRRAINQLAAMMAQNNA